MGVVTGISFDDYPRQGSRLHKRVSVCYEYDTDKRHEGTCIRDDMTTPFRTIFALDNGRIIDAIECQWSPR